MTEIPARELRNHVSEVLRRVEAGEELTVTVSGRPVATLSPARRKRPRSLPTSEVLSWPKADAGLHDELRRMLPETTDDEYWPGP
jgi:prevent-host-death family protein